MATWSKDIKARTITNTPTLRHNRRRSTAADCEFEIMQEWRKLAEHWLTTLQPLQEGGRSSPARASDVTVTGVTGTLVCLEAVNNAAKGTSRSFNREETGTSVGGFTPTTGTTETSAEEIGAASAGTTADKEEGPITANETNS